MPEGGDVLMEEMPDKAGANELPPSISTDSGEGSVLGTDVGFAMNVDAIPSQTAAKSNPKLESNTNQICIENGAKLNVDVIPAHIISGNDGNAVPRTGDETLLGETSANITGIPSQAGVESGQIPVSSTDDVTTTKADVSQATDKSGEIPVSNTNAGTSMKATVIPEKSSEEHSISDQTVKSVGDGSSLINKDVSHSKVIGEMSDDERIAMRRFIAEKTREFRIIGTKFCEEKKIPFPRRKAFNSGIYELYKAQKLDEKNVELMLILKAQRTQLEGGKDDGVDPNMQMGDGRNAMRRGNKLTPEFGEFRDMARIYCASKKIPFPSRKIFSRIFDVLERNGKLDEESLKSALDKNAEQEAGPSLFKPVSKMKGAEKSAFLNKLKTLKVKMKPVVMEHCHTIKAPFPHNDYHRISRNLLEAGKLNEDSIKCAIEQNFVEECKYPLTRDQVDVIVEHYCKDIGINDTTGKIKDDIIGKIPKDLLNRKHYWELMYEDRKTNLFPNVKLNPVTTPKSSGPPRLAEDVREAPRSRQQRRAMRLKNKKKDDRGIDIGILEPVPQVTVSKRTQKRAVNMGSVGNGDLRAVLNDQKRRKASSREGTQGVDGEPIQDILAQIAEKTRLLEGLRTQNYGSSSSSGFDGQSRGQGFGYSYPIDRTGNWEGQDDVRLNPPMRRDGSWQRRDDCYSRRSGAPLMTNYRDDQPIQYDQPIEWTRDTFSNFSNPGTSYRRSLNSVNPPVVGGQLTKDRPFFERGKICKVAIVDETYPERCINAQEANLIRDALFDRIGSSGIGPRISKSYEEQGAVVFDCEDQQTVTWVWVNASTIKPWGNARLKPTSWEKCSKVISIEVPKVLENHSSEAICERLEKQNPGLSTRLWNLKFTEPTPRCLTFGFDIDDESMKCLKSLNFQPFLGFSRVIVQVIRE